MITIEQFQSVLDTIEQGLHKVRSQHVNTDKLKNNIRQFVQMYFKDFRNNYNSSPLNESLTVIDNDMQDLLRCIQRRTSVAKYKKILKRFKSSIHELEVQELSLVNKVSNQGTPTVDTREKKIIETLNRIYEPSAVSYEQALCDLSDMHRKSWRGTAVELREALRELLDRLAPAQEVQSEPTFKLEPNTKAPTVRQKVIFILKKRNLSSKQLKVNKDAINVIDDLVGKFVRSVYESSSEATHVPMTKDDVIRIKQYLDVVLSELLEIPSIDK